MTKMDQFVQLAAERDAIEMTQVILAGKLTEIKADLDQLSAELTDEGADGFGNPGGRVDLLLEEEIPAGIDYKEEQYPYLDSLQVA